MAWINCDKGQYAKIKNIPTHKDFYSSVNSPTVNQKNVDYEKNYQIAFKNILNKNELEIRNQLDNTIDNIYNGIMPKGNQVVLKEVPDNLQQLGVHNKPMLMSPREIRNAILSKEEAINIGYPIGKNDSYHQLGKKGFYEVLSDLSDPVMVIKEGTNKIIVFTEQFDYKGKQIIVPIEINTNSEYNAIEVQDVNILKSMHGRSSIFNYINNLLNKTSDILYKNTKKIQSLSDNRKVQYPEAISSVSDNIIANNNKNVKLPPAISNNSMQNNENNTIKSSKTSNPLEISKLTKEDANTTSPLPKRTYQKGKGESSFHNNITEKSKFLNEDLREMMKDEETIQYYQEITNKDTLEKAYEKLQEGGMEETAKWFNKDVEKGNISAVDVTEGWILLKQYQDAGDYLSAVEVAKRMRDIGTKAGQTVQGIGGMVPSILTGGSDKIGKVSSYLTLGARSFGSASEEALANGAQIDEATLYGILNTAVEIGSEMVTGGIPGTNTNGWLDKLTDKEISKISSKIVKKIAKSGYSFVGEASEEALAEILNPIIKNMSYTEGETIDWNAVVESAIVGGLTGQILNAPSDFSSQTIDNYSGQIISNNNQMINVNEQSNNSQMDLNN